MPNIFHKTKLEEERNKRLKCLYWLVFAVNIAAAVTYNFVLFYTNWVYTV